MRREQDEVDMPFSFASRESKAREKKTQEVNSCLQKRVHDRLTLSACLLATSVMRRSSASGTRGATQFPSVSVAGSPATSCRSFPPRVRASSQFKRAWRPAGMPRNGSAEADEACDAEGLLAGWDA